MTVYIYNKVNTCSAEIMRQKKKKAVMETVVVDLNSLILIGKALQFPNCNKIEL